MILNKYNKILILQLILIVVSVVYYCIVAIFNINGESCILGLKLLIILSFVSAIFSLYILRLGLLHIYSVFYIVVSLYNMSYVFLSFTRGDYLLFSPENLVMSGVYSNNIVSKYLFAILFFSLFVHLGAMLLLGRRYESISMKSIWRHNDKIEFYGLFLFYAFMIPALYYYYSFLKQILLSGGYINKYGISTDEMNILIRVSDDLFKLGFILILVSKSKIKTIILPCVIYLTIQFCASVITGSRVFFVSQFLFVLVYFSLRFKIKYTTIFSLLFALVLFSVVVGSLRQTDDYDTSSITVFSGNSLLNEISESFIISQGMSMHTLALTVYMIENKEFDTSIRYLVYPLFIKGGYVNEKFPDDYYYIADRLSNRIIQKKFIGGGGLGSSIIADFYASGGLFMVVFLSLLYGICIAYISLNMFKSHDFLFVVLLILPGLFYVGRAHPFYPIISVYKLIFFYLILIRTGLLEKLRLLLKSGKNIY